METNNPPINLSDPIDIEVDDVPADLISEDLKSEEIPNYSTFHNQGTRDDFEFHTLRDILRQRHKPEFFETESVIDKLLVGHGIKSGDVIEVCGCSLSGKTMLVTSYALSLLAKYSHIQIAFIDTKNDIQRCKLQKMLECRGLSDEDIGKNFFNRILLFNAANIYELESTLKTIIEGQSDYRKITLIVIDSITVPFYQALGSYKPSMRMTSRVHELIFELAKGHNKTVMITNLQIHKFVQPIEKIPQYESSDDSSSEEEQKFQCDTETSKPALTKYWGEILNVRLLISAPDDRKDDMFALFDAEREIKVIESDTAMPLSSILVNITDKGIE